MLSNRRRMSFAVARYSSIRAKMGSASDEACGVGARATGTAAAIGSATSEFMTVLRVIVPPAPLEQVGGIACGSLSLATV